MTTTMSTAPFAGHASYSDPKDHAMAAPSPVPKVKAEGQANFERNKGTMKDFFDQSRNMSYNSPRPSPKCPTKESAEQYQKHRGCVGDLIAAHPFSAPKEPKFPSRAVKPEAAENAKSHNGSSLARLLGSHGTSRVTSRAVQARGVKPEANDNFTKNRGVLGHQMSNYGKLSGDGQPNARVTAQGEQNMRINSGSSLMKTIQQMPPTGRQRLSKNTGSFE